MPDAIVWSASGGGEVCLCGIGARTPLGLSALASAAALRGSISAVIAHRNFIDQAGEPAALACDAEFEAALPIVARMERMLVAALAEALDGLATKRETARVQCIIGLPEGRPGLPNDLGSRLLAAVCRAFGMSPADVHLLPHGHAAGLMAMQLAAQRVATHAVPMCVAAGVDSYHDHDTIAWLDHDRRLMSAIHRNGFPPGEAAGACLLASRAAADAAALPVMGRVIRACTSREAHTLRSIDVCVGEGLTVAMQGALSDLRLPEQAITATYCDLNGERYRNEEFVYALLRTQEAFVDAHDYLHPADCWGDVGAASGPLFAALAIAARQRGCVDGAFPLLWAGSESGHRAAVVLHLGEA